MPGMAQLSAALLLGEKRRMPAAIFLSGKSTIQGCCAGARTRSGIFDGTEIRGLEFA